MIIFMKVQPKFPKNITISYSKLLINADLMRFTKSFLFIPQRLYVVIYNDVNGMAIIKQYNKRTGLTYAYESYSYWDKKRNGKIYKRLQYQKRDVETSLHLH